MPSKKKKYNSRFPPARIKKIMQTDEDIGKVAAAVPVLISKCLEMFLVSLLSQAGDVTRSRKAKTMSTSHIKQCITEEQKFDFLKELVEAIPDVQNEEEAAAFNDDDTHKKMMRKRSLPRSKKEQKKRPRTGTSNNTSNDETDSSDEHSSQTQGLENVSQLLSPTTSTEQKDELTAASGSMQFHIPIDNIIAASKLLSDGLHSSQSESDSNHVHVEPQDGIQETSKVEIVLPQISPIAEVKDQVRQGVIVTNTSSKVSNLEATTSSYAKNTMLQTKSPKIESKNHQPYTPVTVPLHLSPQLPNSNSNTPQVQPGGMLSLLYSGLPPSLPGTTGHVPPSYMYTPLSQPMKQPAAPTTTHGKEQLPPNYYRFQHFPPHDPTQLSQLSTQRHYLGYPQAMLTPTSSTCPQVPRISTNHVMPKPPRKPSEEDDDYDA